MLEINSKGDSPEQIAAYIDARKKNFPTRVNIIAKEEEAKEKMERGELLAPKVERFGKRKGVDSVTTEDECGGKKHCTWYLRGSCKFGKRCTYVHDPLKRAESVCENRMMPRKIGSLIVPKPAESLLRKLLEKEIHAEESLALQCVRYLVRTRIEHNE